MLLAQKKYKSNCYQVIELNWHSKVRISRIEYFNCFKSKKIDQSDLINKMC